MSNIAHKLKEQAGAASVLVANLRAVLGEDEELILDTIEGETDLLEVIDKALARLAEIKTMVAAIKLNIDELSSRRDRFVQQDEMIRAALTHAMGMANLRKAERPLGTISLRATPPKLIETEAADIPSQYWTPQPPKLDRKAVLEALKAGEAVPGAELSNGGETISIRVK